MSKTSSMKKNGMGSHQSHNMTTDEWLTPPEIVKALAPIDLDPCAPIIQPWKIADKCFTIIDDGLNQPWEGFVYCNPPYGKMAAKWLEKLANHDNGIALIFARTETEMFFDWVWPYADSLLFIKGRLTFWKVDGTPAPYNGGAPSVMVAYGKHARARLIKSGIPGQLLNLR
ncbi:phage N-6-adenine-methyltransferase [Dyadobacter sp. CY312]|uniref:phage N-6-adenine-methyltransferase n=1 Tax=Dyadobacter sp. CY312 TaxID=2907303 RepID=UPI001F2DB9AF|nr:phage N-6-adenine-methyltransferase [Dyadobacter sp. CY312]MCE7039268.1 phage N-6-adenine-methyltransferase [Dyadobacter sp. CY312]